MKVRQPAAATVQHRGITISIYGPMADRKREVYRLAYYVGSRRKRPAFKGSLEDAKKKAKEIANGLGAGDLIDALHLTPLDRRIYLTAKEAVAPLGLAVDHVCRDAAAALALLAPNMTLLEAAREWRRQHIDEFCRHHQYQDPPRTRIPVTRSVQLPRVSGIYFIWLLETIVYVGMSTDLGKRCRTGKKHEHIEEGDSISWVEEPIHRLRHAEAFYIGVYNPTRNFPTRSLPSGAMVASTISQY